MIAGLKPRTTGAKRRNPFSAALTMLVTGGMIAVAGLPAYASAFQEADPARAAAVEAAVLQTVAVDASASLGDVSRAAFTATTPEELRQMQKAAAAAAAAAAATARRATQRVSWATSVVQSAGDDYPWANHAGGSLSPLRYVYRQCVDFVAWRLNRDAGSTQAPFKYDWSNLTPGGGDGRQWLPAWRNHGWPVSNVPIAGAVAYTGGNHVAYVKEVMGNGDVVLEEYNWVPQSYSQRIVPSSSVAAFLYPPPR